MDYWDHYLLNPACLYIDPGARRAKLCKEQSCIVRAGKNKNES